jgi:hypothetical protein
MRWMVPKIWEGGDVWIIGGGPSMPKQFSIPEEVVRSVVEGTSSPSVYSPYMSVLHDKHVIGVNMAYQIGDWIDVIFFGDCSFLDKHELELAKHPALKVSCHPRVQSRDWIKFLPHANHPRGISRAGNSVSWNGNSGAAAISLAVHAGAKRIILLGFDMCLVDNRQHWHGAYRINGKAPDAKKNKQNRIVTVAETFERHSICFPMIAQDAKKYGVQILNASPESQIKEFPKCTVQDILNDRENV